MLYAFIANTGRTVAIAMIACLATFSACTVSQYTIPGSGARELGRTPSVFEDPELVQTYQNTITPDELAAHLYFFASDLFEGRETSTRGQKLAASYLASQYQRLGLEPLGTSEVVHKNSPEAFFQPFYVYGTRFQEASLTATNSGHEIASASFSPDDPGHDAFLESGAVEYVEANIVFGGYGIADASLGYDDYAALRSGGIDHTRSWLLILDGEPLRSAERSLLPTVDGRPSAWTSEANHKYLALAGKGLPRGILVVGDVGPNATKTIREQGREKSLAYTAVGTLSLNKAKRTVPSALPPTYVISSTLANQLLKPSGKTVTALQQEIDSTLQPIVFEVPDVTLSSTVRFESFRAQTENVVAMVPGKDPDLKDEVVIISSHYDHVGVLPTGEGDTINNGADDNGSGTTTLIEIAEAFMKAKADGNGPRRSILFINVSGEEKGLLGSEYYADFEPIVPLEKTVTNLNADMIGRHDPTLETPDDDYVYIIGSRLISQELHDINARVNVLTKTDLSLNERFNAKTDPNRFYARSDHWNFGKHGVPFIFFFTGTHEDYHKPGDEAYKIDYARMARIGRLIFATAWQVANQDRRPVVSGDGFM